MTTTRILLTLLLALIATPSFAQDTEAPTAAVDVAEVPAPPPTPWSSPESAAARKADLVTFFEGAEVRTIGSPGNRLMEERIDKLFADSGFDHGEIRFQAPALRTGKAYIELDGPGRVAMLPLHTGLFRPGNTPSTDMEKRLIYGGTASVADLQRLNGVDLDGAFMVLEFNCGEDWVRMIRFGVEGFIFLAPSDADSYTREAIGKVTNSEVAVPRFLVQEAQAATLREALATAPQTAAIHAEPSTWESTWLRNLWVFIPGADTEGRGRQVVTFVAPIDSNGVAPDIAQSGTNGANLFLLMQLLEEFKENPPQTSVVLAAVNGHTQGHVGERQLAFHLLERPETALQLRNLVTKDIREAELILDNYSAINLDVERPELADKLAELAAAIPEMTGLSAVVDGESVRVSAPEASTTEDETASDSDAAEPEDDGLAAVETKSPQETLAEAKSRLQMRLGVSLDDSAFPVVTITAVKSAEELLIEMRSLIDDSLSVNVKIKERLMVRARSEVNLIKTQMLKLTRDDTLDDATREAKTRELNEKKDHYVHVLTMFNKVGVKTALSELTDAEREIFAGYLREEVDLLREWVRLNREEREQLTKNRGIFRALDSRPVSLMVQLNLDWQSPTIGFSTMRPTIATHEVPELGKLLAAQADSLQERVNRPNLLRNTMTKLGGLPQEHYFPEATTALQFYMGTQKTPSIALRNVYSTPYRIFTPADTIAAVPAETLDAQVAFTCAYAQELLTAVDLPKAATSKRPSQKTENHFTILRAIMRDEFTADGIIYIEDAAMMCIPSLSRPEDYKRITDGDVANFYPQIADARASRIFFQIESEQMTAGFKFDDDYRQITHMIDAGENQLKIPTTLAWGVKQRRLTFFECGPEFRVASRYDPTKVSGQPIQMDTFQILDGMMNSTPRKFGLLGMGSVSSPQKVPYSLGPVAVVLEENPRLKLLGPGKRLAIKSTEDKLEGEGYASPAALGDDFLAVAATDMTSLNQYRLGRMIGVTNELATNYLARGTEALGEMQTAKSEKDHLGYLSALYESLGSQVKAYAQIDGMTQDMLKAIIAYMVLLLPFCFFTQKLLFKFVRIEAQMATFGGIFILIFAIFRFIHPAFRLARAPEAILIAFIMFALGMFVILILHARFEGEMKVLFQTFSGVDKGEVGMGSVGQKAMLIGVNNMKRRRTRTALTTGTIVLVTFAMLAFSSVSKTISPTFVPSGDEARYTGVQFHNAGGTKLDADTVRVFQEMFADSADRVVVRYWDTPPVIGRGQSFTYRVETASGEGIPLDGVLGLVQGEWDLLSPNGLPVLEGGRYFSSDGAAEVMLPAGAAEVIGLTDADVGKTTLYFRGLPLLLVGLLDDTRLTSLEDLDRRQILPMEALQPSGAGGDDPGGDDAGDDSSIFYVAPSNLLVLPGLTAQRLGAEPYSVSVRLKPGVQPWTAIDTMLTVTNAKFWIASDREFPVGPQQKAKLDAGTYYVGSAPKPSVGGLQKLIVPILIAGTIILNTMLGSVYERKYEIAVYNAIGLNPTHIGLFFLAEAFVYAVIGSVGGYLIGQVLALAITNFNLIQGLDLNFSSLQVVYVIIFTVVVVLLSTLYPAVVATRAAVPSGKRTWSLPPNDGEKMQLILPFIYQPRLVPGIIEYLDDYFMRFTEASTGEMIATPVRKERTDGEGDEPQTYDLAFDLALAPYDLGVTQRLHFNAHMNPEIQSYQIEMTATRTSGQDANWVSTNRPFLEKLRKHMMHWRNMTPDNQGIYVARANAEFDGTPLPSVDEPAPTPFEEDSVPVSEKADAPPERDQHVQDDGLALFDEGAGPESKQNFEESHKPDAAADSDADDDTSPDTTKP